MKLVKLLWADIYRDGGSYEAEFSTDEDLNYCVFLERSRMFDGEGLHDRWLYEYRGSVRPENCLPLITGSREEQQLIDRLDRFLKANPKSVDVEQNESNNYLSRLEKLLYYIPLREPCFPADIKQNFSRRI